MRLRHRKWTDKVLLENQDIGKNLETLELDSLKQFTDLEIGSGLGSFLLSCSEKWPERKFLGVEISKNAFASAIKKASAVKDKQTNFLFLNAPIERVFPLFSDEQLTDIYINFPDPWPKKKQKSRRLTYPTRLKEYYRILKKDGTLYFRTDNIDLFMDSLEYFKEFQLFSFQVISPFYSEKTDYLPTTEYETKFREQGIDINVIIAKKKQ